MQIREPISSLRNLGNLVDTFYQKYQQESHEAKQQEVFLNQQKREITILCFRLRAQDK